MRELSTTPMQSVRQLAADALSNYGVIDVANREQVLANRPDMVETLAALDHACDELSPAEIVDLQSADIQHLRAAMIAYRDMRKQRTGLAVDAAAGGMTSATFAQWLCCFAAIPRCPGCDLFVLGGAGHLCMMPSDDGLPCIGVGIIVDRARGVVIIRTEHTLDVELPTHVFLHRSGFRPEDVRPFANQSTATSVVYKIRRRGQPGWSDGGAVPCWTKNGRTWNSPHALKAHLHEVVKHKFRTAGYYPVTDTTIAEQVPPDWEIVTIATSEACTQDVDAFVAAHPTASR